jgi:mannose/fructose/N-acetylgalactosamine-specific phosphotransferase system component IID
MSPRTAHAACLKDGVTRHQTARQCLDRIIPGLRSLVHAVLSVWHVATLEAVAPLAFLAFVVALAGWMLRVAAATPWSPSPPVPADPGR